MIFIVSIFWIAVIAGTVFGLLLASRGVARRRALAKIQEMGLTVQSLASVRSSLLSGNCVWSFYAVTQDDIGRERRAYLHIGHWLAGPLSSQVKVEWD